MIRTIIDLIGFFQFIVWLSSGSVFFGVYLPLPLPKV